MTTQLDFPASSTCFSRWKLLVISKKHQIPSRVPRESRNGPPPPKSILLIVLRELHNNGHSGEYLKVEGTELALQRRCLNHEAAYNSLKPHSGPRDRRVIGKAIQKALLDEGYLMGKKNFWDLEGEARRAAQAFCGSGCGISCNGYWDHIMALERVEASSLALDPMEVELW